MPDRFHISMSILRVAGRRIVPVVAFGACMSLAALSTTFSGQSTAVYRNVSSFRGTLTSSSSVDVDGARFTSIEIVFPVQSTADESLPSAVGLTPYVYPNERARGINNRLRLANVASAEWGCTILPESKSRTAQRRAFFASLRPARPRFPHSLPPPTPPR